MKARYSFLQNNTVNENESKQTEDVDNDETIISKIFDGYQGELLYNSLHGCGRFRWLSNNGLATIYNGHFFVNDLEGYGRVVYSSGGCFEGLFKRSRRFGPGVYTYPYGFQDVGLWDGNYLLRLSCSVNSKVIPQLAFTPNAKYRLLKFRKLVTISPEVSNKPEEILTMLDFTGHLARTICADRLYNNLVRNRDSTFLDKNLFNKLFFGCKSMVEVLSSAEEENQAISTISKCLTTESGRNDLCVLNDKEIQLQFLNKYVETMTMLIEYLNSKKEEIQQGYFDVIEIEEQEEREEGEEEEIEGPDDFMQLLHYKDELEQFFEAVPWLLRATSALKRIYRRMKRIAQEGDCLEDYEECFDNIKEQFLQKLEDLLRIAMYNKEIFVAEREKLLKSMEFAEEEEEEDKEIENKEQKQECRVKTLNPSDILAWNNEETIIDMMTHTYMHQDMEDQVSCDVFSVITGNRSKYKQRGPYEEDCLFFLQCCSSGSIDKINKLCCKYINPDISDCKGNSGMFVAVSNDNIDVIRTLGCLGAAVDIANDECLTPLTLSLCKYLSIFYKVTNWELAFLPPPNKNNLELNFQWYPSKSLDDFLQNPIDEKESEELHVFVHKTKSVVPEKVNDFSDKKQKYVFNTECFRPPISKRKDKGKKKKDKKGKNKKEKDKKKKKKEQSKTKSSRSSSSDKKKEKERAKEEAKRKQYEKEMLEMQTKLDKVFSTISVLLDIGAEPNFGDVPLPPLILAVFSSNVSLISKLLSYDADPNVRCKDKNMTPLHYLASKSLSKEDPRILRTILQYQANPNSRTDSTHWVREAEVILVKEKLKNVNDEGKTALHILSMRYDYIKDDNGSIIIEMVRTLSYFGANTELYYLGHTPLTLAILRGNILLVDEMLKTNLYNPNQILERNMGVPLTVLLLPSYVEVLPPNISKSIIDTLMNYNANPLNIVNDSGNAIEFLIALDKPVKGDKKDKSKKQKKKKEKSTKSSKKSKKAKAAQRALMKFFKEKTRNILIRNIQAKCVKYLFFFVSEECLGDEFITNLATLVTVDEAFKILQLLIENKRIKVTENYKDICYVVLKVIEEANQALLPPRKSTIESQTDYIEEMIRDNLKVIIKPYETNKYLAYPPELDKYNKTKYKVCFNCCCGFGKDLVVCPQCFMVYFCSEACNKQSNTSKTRHKCKGVFYKSEKEKLSQYAQSDIPYESPLEMKLKWIEDLVRERKLNHKLRKRALKEYEMIYGKVKEGKDSLKKLEHREKFIQEKIDYYKKTLDSDKGRIKQKEWRGRNFDLSTRDTSRLTSPVNNNTMVKLVSERNRSSGDRKTPISGNLTPNEAQNRSQWSSTGQSAGPKEKWNSNQNQTNSPRLIEEGQRNGKDNFEISKGNQRKKPQWSSGNHTDSSDDKDKWDPQGNQTKSQWSPKGRGRGSKDNEDPKRKQSNNQEGWSSNKRQIKTPLSPKNYEEGENIWEPKEKRLRATSSPKSRNANSRNSYGLHHLNTKNTTKSLPDTNEKHSNRLNVQQSSRRQPHSLGINETDIDRREQLELLLRKLKQSPNRIPKDLHKFLGKNAAFKLGKICKQSVNYQGQMYHSKIPNKFQVLLEKLTEHMSDFDLKRLLLPYSCFTGDQLYFSFKRSSVPTCGTYSDV